MLGKQISYQNDIATRKYIKKLMALCYIADVHIKPIFEDLAMLAACELLKNLIACINDTWIILLCMAHIVGALLECRFESTTTLKACTIY